MGALSDALRFEVRGFGIDVIAIEPGLIRTRFGEAAAATVTQAGEGPYAGFHEAVATTTRGVYDRPVGRLGGGRRPSRG